MIFLRKIGIICICFFFIFTSFSMVIGKTNNEYSLNDTIYVDDDGGADYTVIQDAIDAANPGDTIFVFNGIYNENLEIYNSLNLVGENNDLTIIDGGGNGDVIYIQANDININGFTIRNNGEEGIGISTWKMGDSYETNINISNNIFCDIPDYAIIISRTSESEIINNKIYNCMGAIRIRSSNSNLIDNNIIFNNNEEGIYLDRSEHNVISNNIVNSSSFGILLTAPGEFTNNNIFGNNQVTNCEYGIMIQYAKNNQFSENLIINNNYGFRIRNDCENNEIFHNSFVENNQYSSEEQNNFWYNITIEEGNFYDDYAGSDADGDGIGDTSYDIAGSGGCQDLFPLMTPLHNIAPSDPNVYGPSSGKIEEEYTYSVCSSDLNNDDLYYLIDWGDGISTGWEGPFPSATEQTFSHTWFEKGEYSVRVRCKDEDGLLTDWTELPVSMPRSKSVSWLFFDFIADLLNNFSFFQFVVGGF